MKTFAAYMLVAVAALILLGRLGQRPTVYSRYTDSTSKQWAPVVRWNDNSRPDGWFISDAKLRRLAARDIRESVPVLTLP